MSKQPRKPKNSSPNTDHLVKLYHKWLKDPKANGKEMSDTVDKIIFYAKDRQYLNPVYWRFEDQDDLQQELRLLCFKRLQSVENPTNKRIFNHLRVAVTWKLKERARSVGKRLDKDKIEKAYYDSAGPDSFTTSTPDFVIDFKDETTQEFAQLLVEGYSKKEAALKLNIIDNALVEQVIDNIKKELLTQ